MRVEIDPDIPPALPSGGSSILSTASQSLAFHSSPEEFISSRIQNAARATADHTGPWSAGSPKPSIVRAKILNRNVAIVSSYSLCKDILRGGAGNTEVTKAATEGKRIDSGTFAARPAYQQLMADFFPQPNILLLDPPDHTARRNAWEEHLSSFPAELAPMVRELTENHIGNWFHGQSIDLYSSLKGLSWQVLLGIFLQIQPSDELYSTIESLQETLLRGQFSLFPVSVRTPLWRSSRSKGLEARRKLQALLKDHIATQSKECPFLRRGKVSSDELTSHALLFTSSIAVKALASLLTASILNLFLMPSEPSLASRVRAETPPNADILLRSILLETERLSPPVVGVMRQAQQEVVITDPNLRSPVLIPAGWDIWLYFSGAGRDHTAFESADQFVPERHLGSEGKSMGFAFGSGAKTCLGMPVVQEIITTISETLLDSNIRLEGSVDAEGVRGWLGWDTGVAAEAFAKDLKQLPCQRPKKPIYVRVLRDVG